MVISMSDTAASGGYYMAMTGDPIVAYPGTLTGSIGVVFGKPNLHGLYDKLGITKDAIQRGTNADIDSDYTPLTPEERALLRDGIDESYQDFVTKVADARHRTFDQIEPLAQGRVWLGSQAKPRGLVDEIGGLDKAIDMVKQKAKIPAERARQPDGLSRTAQHSGHPHEEVAGGHDGGQTGADVRTHAVPRLDARRLPAHDAVLGGSAVDSPYTRPSTSRIFRSSAAQCEGLWDERGFRSRARRGRSRLPSVYPDMNRTRIAGPGAAASRARSAPFIPGITMSVRSRSIGPVLFGDQFQGIARGCGLEHVIPAAGEHGSRQGAHLRFVFHQENGLGRRNDLSFLGGGTQRFGVAAHNGQINFEGRSVAGLAVDQNLSAALLDDSVHDGKSQARTFSLLLGGEKRFEQARLGSVVHAGAGIADGEQGVAAGVDSDVTAGIFAPSIPRSRFR